MTPGSTRHESGAVAILVTAMALLIFAMAAFVVDYGVAFTNNRHLQSGADAAALAGARAIQAAPGAGQSCEDIVAGANAEGSAGVTLAANDALGDATGGQSITAACEDGRAVVDVTTGRAKATQFAGVFGVDEVSVGAAARAAVGPAGSAIGVRPFGICEDLIPAIDPTTGEFPPGAVVIPVDNADMGCGYASGNWAMMDMNGGSNSTAEAKRWIEGGYEDEVVIDAAGGVVISGDTGAPSPGGFDTAMNSIMGTDSVLPVFSEIRDPRGSNAKFVITSFVGVKFCAWKFNGQSGNDSCWDGSASFPDDYLQVRFVNIVTVGEFSSLCRLGDPTCDKGVRVIKLVG